MLKQTIKKWQAGIDAYKAGNLSEAQSCFKSIDDTSKILYCLGVVYFKQTNYGEAANTFGKSVKCDPFLAISYFMQGVACHMKNDLGGALNHYDEAVQALRGHEFIDYRQLGMEYKLLLCEILFNKALCLRGGGLQAVADVMRQATSCRAVRDEKARYRFDDLCNAVASGTNNNAQPYSAPLDLMFQPPKIKDKPPSKDAPPPARPTNTAPSSAGPSAGGSSARPALPATPAPALSAATASNSAPRRQTTTKKLPPRPISLKIDAKVITVKCFYKDRRLIQISASSPDFEELRDKIAVKFVVEDLDIRYHHTSGEVITIRNHDDLQAAIVDNMTEIYLSLPGETNDFEPQSGNSSTSSSPSRTPPTSQFLGSTPPPVLPPKTNGYTAQKAVTSQPTGMSKASSVTGITNKPSAALRPTQTTTTQPTSMTKSSSQPIKAADLTTTKPAGGNKFGAAKAAVAAVVETPSVKPAKQKSVWQECYTDDGERYFFNTETQETSWDPDIDPTPPWMVCHTDNGDKYYYNPTTDASTWDFPG